MKSLPIFLIYLFKEKEILRDTLGIWKSKGQCNVKVTLELYICKLLTWENESKTSLHMLIVDQLMKVEPFSSFSLVLWVVGCWSVHYWFDFILLNVICIFLSNDWLIWIMLSISFFVNLFIFMPCFIWLSNWWWSVFDCNIVGSFVILNFLMFLKNQL